MDRFLGVGISVPGIIDVQGRMIQDSHALGVRKMPCDELSKGIEHPCVFMNDANAAGFAELRESSDMENAVYLSLSNSVGGAFLQGSRLYLGEHQRSGEFGHMTCILAAGNAIAGKGAV